ncbi:hypothetical protein B7Z28_01465 [Candidatus Saccharibacteria bacterium 32-45-3]|nr:MAG: hypothetical protein B7Z28_01465 [Candidatus Saccharibacteria bacterium 32-45-3]
MKIKSGTHGFTIVELLVVIVVIGILAAITVVGYGGLSARAKDTKQDSSIGIIQKALAMYKSEFGRYPYACSENPNLDCQIASLEPYLTPNYLSTMPTVDKIGNVNAMYFAQADRYTILVPYSYKATCKLGVNPSSGYKSTYPLCE